MLDKQIWYKSIICRGNSVLKFNHTGFIKHSFYSCGQLELAEKFDIEDQEYKRLRPIEEYLLDMRLFRNSGSSNQSTCF